MIASAVVDEIQRLLDTGSLSQRKIARRIGVSRGTVNAIALGKRPARRPRSRDERDEFVPPSGPLVRCPICGGLVQAPCLACRVRAKMERGRLRSATRNADRYRHDELRSAGFAARRLNGPGPQAR